MNQKIKFLLLGDFRQFPAIMDNFVGTPVLRELKHCQLLHDLTGGWHHELTENMRSDPGIFDFLTWLRVDDPGNSPWPRHSRRPEKDPTARRAGREPRHLPRPPHPDQRPGQLPPGPARSCHDRDTPTTTNMPQTMRVWPGLKLIGTGSPGQQGHLRARDRSGARKKSCWTAAMLI